MRMALTLLITIVLTQTSVPAFAQTFGIGMTPGMQCPYNYRPGGPAMNGNDQLSNLRGRMVRNREIAGQIKGEIREIDSRLASAKNKMRRVFSEGTVAAIDEHYVHNRSRRSYKSTCGPKGSDSGEGSGRVLSHGQRSSPDAENRVGAFYPPSEFCLDDGYNDWKNVVLDNGMVRESVCDFYVPARTTPPSESAISSCRAGLNDYYRLMAMKLQRDRKLKDIELALENDSSNIGQVRDGISEGTYCAYCNNHRIGGSSFQSGNWLQMGVAAFAIVSAINNRMNRPPPPPYPMPYPMPYMQPGMPNPGGPAFLGRPYQAPMPGYPFVQNGQYGVVNGSIGAGAFGCQGTTPYGFNNPLAARAQPFQNMQADPFNNPFMDPFQNPGGQFAQQPLLNNGFGPGFMPMLGNGINEQNPFGADPFGADPFGADPFNNSFTANPGYAPGMLPMPGLTNPVAPYGNPYWGGGSTPQYNLGLGYQNGYPPSVLPYSGLANSNYFNLPYQNPWGAPYMASPVQNFGWQMDQLKRNITNIQNGGAYGGYGGVPPAVLPMPTPVYNQPGTPMNPVPPINNPPRIR